jgi:hypothetical protein
MVASSNSVAKHSNSQVSADAQLANGGGQSKASQARRLSRNGRHDSLMHRREATTSEANMPKFTALDADPARLDAHEQNFVEEIRRHGWFAIHVSADDDRPGFAYTTGFWLKFQFPELIVFELAPRVAQDTFWHTYRELEAGKRFGIGKREHGIFENVPAVLLPVSQQHHRSYLGWTRWFYGNDEFQSLQLVYRGHFPWSEQASLDFRAGQPDLTAGNWPDAQAH